jgi:hypothetical protein
VALADHLNPQFVVADIDTDPRLKSYFSGKKTRSSIIEYNSRSSMVEKVRYRKSKLFL